jgi:flagellar biosynthesis protein FlhG
MEKRAANKLVAVASGKGGVGKTVCTANLALQTATRYRTLAVDLDINCGNLNTCVGVKLPTRSINDFLTRRVASLQETWLRTSLDTLQLISCSYRGSDFLTMNQAQRQNLVNHLRESDFRYTFLDLGAGVHADTLDFFSAADIRILITSPESLAMHNAFVFIKSVIYRNLFRELEKEQFLEPIRKKLIALINSNGDVNVEQVIGRLRSWDRYSAYIVQGLVDELKIHVVLNMWTQESEKKYVINFYNLVKKYLSLEVLLLGLVPYDPEVKKSVKEFVPFSLACSESPAAKSLEEISRKLENL